MSIYLANVDIPEEGHRISILSDGHAYYEDFTHPYVDLGEVICIPPHGRLVEDTAVQDQIDEWLDTVGTIIVGHGLSYYGELMGCIQDATTIVPTTKE